MAVPVIDVDLTAQAVLTIDRLATANIPQIHRFPDGSDQMIFSDSGSATGLGDVELRGKYRLTRAERGGLALGLDLRLPTGDYKDLLGTGATQTKLFLIGSGDFGKRRPARQPRLHLLLRAQQRHRQGPQRAQLQRRRWTSPCTRG